MFEKYKEFIKSLPKRKDKYPPDNKLLIWRKQLHSSKIESYYAPFEYVNKDAKIILVGITPGHTQMNRALNAAKDAIEEGYSDDELFKRVKQEGSFSGKLRENLVQILDKLRVNEKLGVGSTSSLWAEKKNLVHFTSLFKYPIFVNGKDYNGSPPPTEGKLYEKIQESFVNDLNLIEGVAELIPLSKPVAEVIAKLKKEGHIQHNVYKQKDNFIAIPHPSGANAESVALFLMDNYPTKIAYQNYKYENYLNQKPWLSRGGKPQPEELYKKIRAKLWESIYNVREAYNIPKTSS